MSLIKLAFWIGLVVLLLPTDAQQQARLYQTAVHTIERASTFCDRNARTCEIAAEGWAMFLKKAEFAGRLVGDLISQQGRQPERPEGTGTAPAQGTTQGANNAFQGTLLPADVEAAWRGPSARRAGT